MKVFSCARYVLVRHASCPQILVREVAARRIATSPASSPSPLLVIAFCRRHALNGDRDGVLVQEIVHYCWKLKRGFELHGRIGWCAVELKDATSSMGSSFDSLATSVEEVRFPCSVTRREKGCWAGRRAKIFGERKGFALVNSRKNLEKDHSLALSVHYLEEGHLPLTAVFPDPKPPSQACEWRNLPGFG